MNAHNVDRVSRELRQQGFDQLEFSRTKPPFKLDACRGGERFHLHVDFYGKVTEQTSIGSCNEDDSQAPAAASPGEAASEQEPAIMGDCKRYVPAAGVTVSVPCEER